MTRQRRGANLVDYRTAERQRQRRRRARMRQQPDPAAQANEGPKTSREGGAEKAGGEIRRELSRALSKPEPIEFTDEIAKIVAQQMELSRACLMLELPRIIEENFAFLGSGGP